MIRTLERDVRLACVTVAACFLLALMAVAGCRPAQEPARGTAAVSPQQIASLFAKLEGNGTAGGEGELIDLAKVSRADPNWPTVTYLAGEIHLKRGEIEPARAAFRALATWAVPPATTDVGAAGIGDDGWGGSGLAGVALWRWLKVIDEYGGTAQEVESALAVAADLQKTRLFAGMVRSGLLPALPLLEEDVARRLAHVAIKAKRPEAMALFLDFINIDSTGEPLDALEEQLLERMIEEHVVTQQRLDLFRYRRQLSRVTTLAKKEEAAAQLKRLSEDESAPAEVRAEAGYEWGNFYRRTTARKPEVVEKLTAALSAGRGVVAEKALYKRAMVEGSVKPKHDDLFYADMQRLLERYPASRLADDALYQIATEQLFGAPAEPDRAFETFAKLRAFPGANDWQDSAYFLPAMGLLDRGTPDDLEAADRLLAQYIEGYPDGVFRQRALFWRARIAESRQDPATARSLFQQVVEEAPFDYQGLRARMHLEEGAGAIAMALPRPGSVTFRWLHDAYRRSGVQDTLAEATPYHARLRAAEASGVYVKARAAVDDIGPRFHNRLDNLKLEELDEHGLIPGAALLLSWRQDALAACDVRPSADNQLRLAAFLGHKVGDWPTAMRVTAVPGDAPRHRGSDLQNDPRYLATAYPDAAALEFLREPLAQYAWPIGGSQALGQSLLYAVIRRESAYFPGAISAAGAIGLFQIMPLTFTSRADCWILDAHTPQEQAPTPTSYLFNPIRNTQFWSCWVRKEFEPKNRDDIALMLVRHHAGTGHLKEWQAAWQGRAIENDLELQIATLRFPATRIFVQHVLVDVAIADAAGLFEAGGGEKEP